MGQVASLTLAILLLVFVSYLKGINATSRPTRALTKTESEACLKSAVDAFMEHIIPFELYVQNLPKCITTVGYDGDCAPSEYGDIPSDDVIRLNAFFSCINQRNYGQEIDSVVLWSGQDAMKRAQEVAKDRRDRGNKAFEAGDIDAFNDGYRTIIKAEDTKSNLLYSQEVRDMVLDLMCFWLIWHSDDIDKQIDVYQSIDFDFRGTSNVGKKDLLESGVRKALMINGHFWKLEQLAVAHVAIQSQKDVDPEKRKSPILNLNMQVVDGEGNAIGGQRKGWDNPKDFFSDTWSQIPVVIRPMHDEYYGIHPIRGIKTLLDLTEAYNEQLGEAEKSKKIKMPYALDQFDNMLQYVIWTKSHFTVEELTVGRYSANCGMKLVYGEFMTHIKLGYTLRL